LALLFGVLLTLAFLVGEFNGLAGELGRAIRDADQVLNAGGVIVLLHRSFGGEGANSPPLAAP